MVTGIDTAMAPSMLMGRAYCSSHLTLHFLMRMPHMN